ncbi:MAG: HAMP domain-containing histidine kinase [Alphaproteobacteria bacterium]|nr:HAMP domain-containing histidine kinase [Alphaproteobacteria bacterium]
MTADALKATQAAETAAKIEQEKIRLVFGTWVQYVDGIPFAIGIAVIMSGIWPTLGNTGPLAAIVWVGAVVAWSCGSLGLQRYYTANPARHAAAVWQRMQVAMFITHGLVWGGLVWVFWDAGNTVNQAILCILGLGSIVAMFFLTSASFRVMCSSLSTLTLGIWSAFLTHDGALAQVFSVVFPLFALLLLRYGRATAKQIHATLQLRFENEALAAAVIRANKAKSDFLSSMSHELRTPLNSIIGYADLIRQETFGPIMPERYASYVGDIAASGAHLLSMISDLLDLAKIEAGKREFDATPVHLAEVAADVLRFVEPMAARAHVSVMIDAKHDAIVRADERSVKQMLLNLASNAVKFSKPGGIAVVFCEVQPNGRIALGVKDTGTGMTAAEQAKALEPFVQATNAETVEGHGTGLGLPIVKGLIEAHQGLLRIESTKGLGSKIWVEFPAERLMRVKEETAA